MNSLALADRDQLPDALRVLLAEYPRDGWETDPGFDGLIRFWLDRHVMFRRLMAEMRSGTEALLDRKIDDQRYVAMTSRYGGMFVNGLHEHHTIEDTYYFPKLVTKDARIEKGFGILDQDHHDLDVFLSGFVERANEVIGVGSDHGKLQTSAGRFRDELEKLERLLDRHLVDEEELVVPVILRYGAPELG